ncbi:hypothetical protein [Sphingobacterium sp. JUb56]|uniref:hypothetical protein n=1 Tax=Sphingobacterium sp. JUb56 TaxID=2587145 RepID=UPI00160A2785|nr:hypothetical protein [Sphingobacterium sp. JUb56]MBB2950173.1 hypothetical protein [Sphingobacterium sp. JUb56]
MNIISDLNTFKSAFKLKVNKDSHEDLAIFLQENNTHIISREYVDIIEKEVENTDLWETILKELMDEGRLKSLKSTSNNANEICVEMYNTFKQSPCVLLTKDNKSIDSMGYNNIDLKKEENKVIKKVLKDSTCIVTVHDFDNDEKIKDFFKKIFSLQTLNTDIFIFNREFDLRFLNHFKDAKVHYYTLLKNKHYDQSDLKSDSKNKRTYEIIGGRMRCYYTFNRKIIHERKVIIGNLIISPDNAFINLNINDPTWQITISNNPRISSKWKEKCNSFLRLN